MSLLRGAAPARLWLADHLDSIVVRQVPAASGQPVITREWDPGAPGIREASQARPGFDGMIDDSMFYGARTVSLDLVVFGDATHSAYHYAERLASMTQPSRRPYLYVTRGGEYPPPDYEWRMLLRGTPFAITYGRRAASMLELQLTFTAPDGCFEGPERNFLSSAATPASGGLVFPADFPISFGTPAGGAGGTFTLDGSLPVGPILAIAGPTSNPQVSLSTGQQFTFNNLGLAEGQTVKVNMAAGTVHLNDDADDSLYHTVDWTSSTFWRLPPGTYTATMSAKSGSFKLLWRTRRLTV